MATGGIYGLAARRAFRSVCQGLKMFLHLRQRPFQYSRAWSKPESTLPCPILHLRSLTDLAILSKRAIFGAPQREYDAEKHAGPADRHHPQA
jgi:hypothetical protein